MASNARHVPIPSIESDLGTPGPVREQIPYSATMRHLMDREFRGQVAYIWPEFVAAGNFLRHNGGDA